MSAIFLYIVLGTKLYQHKYYQEINYTNIYIKQYTEHDTTNTYIKQGDIQIQNVIIS